jgi:PPOX class probable F420-dependent enzyme
MDIHEAIDFVRGNSFSVLSTQRADGTPQMSPVNTAVDDQGRLTISSRQTAVKVKNLVREPRAWLMAFTTKFYGPWVQLSGPAEIVSLPEALPLLEVYYRTLSGEHPDWDDYRATMVADRRVLMTMTVERVYGDRI